PLVPLLADLGLRNKLDDFDVARWWWLQFLQILFRENHVSSGFNLVAFLNLFGWNFVARVGIDHVLLHTLLGPIVEYVKTDGAVLYRGVKLHGHLSCAEFQFTFP